MRTNITPSNTVKKISNLPAVLGLLLLFALPDGSAGSEPGWVEMTPLPVARTFSAVEVLDGAIYVAGGQDTNWVPRSEVYRYDGSNWAQMASLPGARVSMGFGAINGKLYLVGGLDTNMYRPMTNLYCFDGSAWSEMPGLSTTWDSGAASTLNGSMYLIGGAVGGRPTNSVSSFDGTNWTEEASLPSVRCVSAACTMDNAIYVAGGVDMNWKPQTDVYKYDGTNWSKITDLPSAREAFGFVGVAGKLYVIGGCEGRQAVSNVLCFDGTEWTEIEPMQTIREGMMTVVLNDRIYCVGGDDWYTVTNSASFFYGGSSAGGPGSEAVTTNTATPICWLEGHGLTNDFEVAATNDSDGDGVLNWQEYIADTDPTNADSCLRIISISAGEVTIAGGTGVVQYLERTSNLMASAWTTIETIAAPTPARHTIAIAQNGVQGFYRIRTVR